jgi:cell division septation protein DedD
MKQEATEQDPFSDLFDDRGGAYSFQEEVASSLAYGPTGGTPVAAPIMPAPVAEPVPTPTPIEEPTPPANNINGDIIPPTLAPTDEYNDDFYNDSYNTPDPVKSPMPEVEEGFAPQKIGDHYIIQIGAFSNQKNAMALYEQLRDGGFNAYITDVKIKGKNLMRVRIGYFKTIEEAIQMSQKLEIANKLENRIIKVEYEENK